MGHRPWLSATGDGGSGKYPAKRRGKGVATGGKCSRRRENRK